MASGSAAAHRAFERGGVGASDVIAAGPQARGDACARAAQAGVQAKVARFFDHGLHSLQVVQAQFFAGLRQYLLFQLGAVAVAGAGHKGQQAGRGRPAGHGQTQTGPGRWRGCAAPPWGVPASACRARAPGLGHRRWQWPPSAAPRRRRPSRTAARPWPLARFARTATRCARPRCWRRPAPRRQNAGHQPASSRCAAWP